MFSFLKKRVSKNTKKLTDALKGDVTLDDDRIEGLLFDLEISLIESDVALEVVDKIKIDLKKAFLGRTFKRGEDLSKMVKNALKNSLLEIFVDDDLLERIMKGKRPFVIAFVGVNGT